MFTVTVMFRSHQIIGALIFVSNNFHWNQFISNGGHTESTVNQDHKTN